MRRWLDGCERVLTLVAALATFAMMLLTTADAFGRYLLNRPILAAYELTTNYLIVAAVFLAMPYAYRQGANIRVTFLVERLRGTVAARHRLRRPARLHPLLRGPRRRHLAAGPPHAGDQDDVRDPRPADMARLHWSSASGCS